MVASLGAALGGDAKAGAGAACLGQGDLTLGRHLLSGTKTNATGSVPVAQRLEAVATP